MKPTRAALRRQQLALDEAAAMARVDTTPTVPPDVPPGFVLRRRAGVRAVVRLDAADAVADALSAGTLYDYAAAHPARRELQGRGPAYAIPLDGDLRVVVRHNRHGGLFAALTGDRFLFSTRAPRELRTAQRLLAAGVPTPAVVAIVRYPAGGPFARADVATEEIRNSLDLSVVLRGSTEEREAAATATAQLLDALAAAGARHADLNIKNILLQRREGGFAAHVLDVDRVTFHPEEGANVFARNWARLARSVRGWRDRLDPGVGDAWLQRVERQARLAAPASAT